MDKSSAAFAFFDRAVLGNADVGLLRFFEALLPFLAPDFFFLLDDLPAGLTTAEDRLLTFAGGLENVVVLCAPPNLECGCVPIVGGMGGASAVLRCPGDDMTVGLGEDFPCTEDTAACALVWRRFRVFGVGLVAMYSIHLRKNTITCSAMTLCENFL